MNEKERIGGYILLQLVGALRPEQKAELDSWRHESPVNEKLYLEFSNGKQLGNELRRKREQQEEILQKILKENPEIDKLPIPVIPIWKREWVRIAAAVIILFSLGKYFLFTNNDSLVPGIERADLFSSQGIEQELNDAVAGYRCQQAGIPPRTENGLFIYPALSNPNAGRKDYFTMQTKLGEECVLYLTDGTRIWANAESQVRYPSNMNQDTIHIQLNGETFVELPKHSKKWYVIRLSQRLDGSYAANESMVIESGGAKINFHAYRNDPAFHITLTNGQASVRVNNFPDSVRRLTPGDQVLLHNDEVQVVSKSDTVQTVAWKNRRIAFHQADIRTIMRVVQRWYKADVVVYKGDLSGLKFNLDLPRDARIGEVKKALEAQGIYFDISEKQITISK